MEIGAKIKYLRLERNVTQEALAEYLGVSPQAVSKWERGAAAPDIGLLPALSIFFGVRIDDFFALSDRARLDRINRMMEHEGFLSQADFDYAERFLKDLCTGDPNRAEAFRMLADLYNHRADGYHRKAEALCKRSIELEPPPRYIDNWASIAEIRRIQKRYAEAAAAYDMVADIQIQDANMAEDAFHVRKNRRLAQQLRSMCSDGL